MRARLLFLAVTILASACGSGAPSETASNRPAQSVAPREAAVQRPVVIPFATEPTTLEPTFGFGTANRDFSALSSGFLAYLSPQQQPVPYLASELPSLEQGTWKMLPDGRMETTYQLRSQATWHDGTPLTASDFVFAYRVHLDPALPASKVDVDRRMSAVGALDDHTLLIQWKEPYIWGGMISGPNFPALPRHLHEDLYTNDKAAYIDGPHWRTEFVGTGPYKIERWDPGVEMVFRAHDGFALGKPKIPQVVVRFIADANAIVANLLSGAADVAFHSSISFPHNQALEQAGWAGTIEYWGGNIRFFDFQQRDWGNQQPAVRDVRVRQALIHAIDRHAIVDGIYGGRTRAQEFWLSADDPAFPAVDRSATKYAYNAERAAALLRDAGWVKGTDGVARNPAGEVLSLPILNSAIEVETEAAVVADYWKAVGGVAEILRLGRAQQADGEFRSKFQAVSYGRRPLGYDTMEWTAVNIPTAENRWTGQNFSGYVNPKLELLWPKVLATIDARQREEVLVEALQAMTADAVVDPTHLQPRSMVYRAGLAGPREAWVGEGALVWNVWEWRWVES